MKQLINLICTLLLTLLAHPQTAYLSYSTWETDGPVKAIHKRGDTVFIGGNFSAVGPTAPISCAVSLSTGKAKPTFAKPNGEVSISIPDGNGGWFVCGFFTRIGGQARNYLARVNADGSIASWNADANDIVEALVLKDGVLYAGGRFRTIGGVTRNYLAAIDANSGAVLPWNPNAGSTVNSMFLGNNRLYVGGLFSNIGGQPRRGIAAFDLATGLVTPWNPTVRYNTFSGIVNSMTLRDSNLYIAGTFTSVGGISRNNLAAIDTATGLATSWNPNPNGFIWTIITTGSKAYVNGAFTSIGGKQRKYLAALDLVSDTALAELNIDPNGSITGLLLANEKLYIGGHFTTINSQKRRIAALDTLGNLLSWNPHPDGQARSLSLIGDDAYISGDFNSIGRVTRYNLAAINDNTGEPTDWNPSQDVEPSGTNDEILCITDDGSKLFVGGRFDSIGNSPRTHLAAFDLSTGDIIPWAPSIVGSVNTWVESIHSKDSILYIGGYFSNLNGQVRNALAAVSANSGNNLDWNPAPSGSSIFVNSIVSNGNAIYIGGSFSSLGSQGGGNFAKIDAVTGNGIAWNPPRPNGTVHSLFFKDNILYAVGSFERFAAETRNYVAAVDTSGNLLPWNPSLTDVGMTVSQINKAVIIGGWFHTVNGQSRRRLAAVDAGSGNLLSWNPYIGDPPGSPSQHVAAILPFNETSVYIGGIFNSVLGESKRNFAKLVTPFALPVELLNFSAKRKQTISSGVICEWSTAKEENTDYFIVERSADGKNFSSIGQLSSKSNLSAINSYDFIDQNVLTILTYYRLKIVDRDGNFTYSKIVTVNKINTTFELTGLYPNVVEKKATLTIVSDIDRKAEIFINDAMGRIVMKRAIVIAKGANTLNLDFSIIESGNYFLSVTSEGETKTLKWIKK